MQMIWSPEYEIGISVIDNQHRRIVDYINDVYGVLEQSAPREKIREVIHNLVDYTLSHFAFEEALMEEAGYSDITVHQLTHNTFVRQLETIRRRFDGGEDIASDLASMLQDWLLQHITSDDVSYSSVVKERILNQGYKHKSWVSRATEKFFPVQ